MWAIGQWKHYFQGPHPIIIQTDHAPLRHLPNQTYVKSRVWRWLAALQGYDVDIRHIPGKKNPADLLSCQLVSDALVRKTSVMDANASYVQKLRVTKMPPIKRFKQYCMDYSIKVLKALQDIKLSQPLKGVQFCSILKIRIQWKTQALKARQQMLQLFRPLQSPRFSWTQK